MSKKNKKKLRRLMRAQMAQTVSKQETPAPIVETAQIAPEGEKKPVKTSPSENDEALEEVRAVKKEIRKILITVSVLIISVIIVYFVNTKTDFILKLGEWLSKTLNISV